MEGRTGKTIRNTAFGLAFKLLDTVVSFVLRTVFIYTLGRTYLGINGLFTNVLTVLSLMELGVGGAIVFSLYEPLAKGDHAKVSALMRLYRRAYAVIGIAVCAVGVALTPALPYIIKSTVDVENLHIIYWLTIANTAISYFLSYRRSLLIADQRADINSKNQMLFRLVRVAVLSVVLFVCRNFVLYLIADVLVTLASNLHITYVAKKRYAHIERAPEVLLDREEKQRIFKYMRATILQKVGQTTVNSTDSILISAFIDTALVGVYANYLLIYTGFESIVYRIFSGITASVGNFSVEKDEREAEVLFRRISFLNFLMTAGITVGLFALINPFISLWIGEDYLLSGAAVKVLVLNFYLTVICNAQTCFISAVGRLSYKNRFRSLVETVVNLVVSLLLVTQTGLGVTGVLLGTTCCFLLGRVWMDVFVLYRHWFGCSPVGYYARYALRLAVTAAFCLVCGGLTERLFGAIGLSWASWLLAAMITVAITGAGMVLLFCRNAEFKWAVRVLARICRRS